MNLIYKRLYMILGIVFGLVVTLQAYSGTFANSFAPKPARISVSSQKFLKNIVPDLTAIHSKISKDSRNQCIADIMQLCIELSVVLLKQDFITLDELAKIQKILLLEKQCLADRTAPIAIDELAVNHLLQKIKDAFEVTTLRGFEPDVRYIKKFLANSSESHERIQVLDTIANISDIIRHFDGVLITDYDVVVLFHIALAVFLMAETR